MRSLDEAPILIGHSFGGLFVQLLLDRGLGAAGIAIDSAPPKGVFAFAPTTLLSLGRIFLVPFGWRKIVRWSFTEFRYAFVHTMSLKEARAIWEAQIVPDSGRPFFQVALAQHDHMKFALVVVSAGRPVRAGRPGSGGMWRTPPRYTRWLSTKRGSSGSEKRSSSAPPTDEFQPCGFVGAAVARYRVKVGQRLARPMARSRHADDTHFGVCPADCVTDRLLLRAQRP